MTEWEALREDYRLMANRAEAAEALADTVSRGARKLQVRLQFAEAERDKLLALLREASLMLSCVLPMAKGYAANNRVGRNAEMIEEAEDALSRLDAVLSESSTKGEK